MTCDSSLVVDYVLDECLITGNTQKTVYTAYANVHIHVHAEKYAGLD